MKYKVMAIHSAVFSECPIVEANTASQAVYLAFKVKARRSGDFHLHFMTEDENGRKCYLKIKA